MMPCYMASAKDGSQMFICGDLGPHCACCSDVGDYAYCDFPVAPGQPCNRALCESHSHEVAPGVHYCDGHFEEWRKFLDSGGVTSELANVVPFRGDP